MANRISTITTKPFREAHLDIFKIADSHRDALMGSIEEWKILGANMQAGTHMIDGRIIYIGAYMDVAPGVVEVFMHPSIYLPQYKLTTLKHIKFWLQHVAEERNARRLQTYGANNPQSDRWLEYLGFKREGVLESYLPDGGATSIWGMICKPLAR